MKKSIKDSNIITPLLYYKYKKIKVRLLYQAPLYIKYFRQMINSKIKNRSTSRFFQI